MTTYDTTLVVVIHCDGRQAAQEIALLLNDVARDTYDCAPEGYMANPAMPIMSSLLTAFPKPELTILDRIKMASDDELRAMLTEVPPSALDIGAAGEVKRIVSQKAAEAGHAIALELVRAEMNARGLT